MASPAYNSNSSGSGTGSTTVTVAHTVAGSLTDSLMILMATNPSSNEATGATWNGTAMLPLEFTSGNFWSQAFYLFAPEAGTYNTITTWPTSVTSAGISVLTITGAKAIGNAVRQSATGTGPSVAVTSDEDDSLLVSFTMSQSATHAPAGSETERTDSAVGAYRFSSQTLAIGAAGDNNMTQTLGSSVNYQINAFAVESSTGFIPQAIII